MIPPLLKCETMMGAWSKAADPAYPCYFINNYINTTTTAVTNQKVIAIVAPCAEL